MHQAVGGPELYPSVCLLLCADELSGANYTFFTLTSDQTARLPACHNGANRVESGESLTWWGSATLQHDGNPHAYQARNMVML